MYRWRLPNYLSSRTLTVIFPAINFFPSGVNSQCLCEKIVCTELIRLHKRKVPKNIVIRTKLLNFIKNLKRRLYIAYFSRYWSSCLRPKLRKCILRKIRIFEKPLVVKPSELFCFKDTINFTSLLLFLSGINRRCIWVKYFELNLIAWPIKSLTALE